ncbi:hypothetical protein ACTFIY_002201 [Dictyostelium cf. discoideum]
MDNLFKLVFNNKFLRKKILNEIKEINKPNIVKKYYQCKINWIIRNNHFELMIYKFKKQIKTREQFTDDLFYLFLDRNIDLEIFKQVLEIFPQFQPNSSKYSSKIIEFCCLNNSFYKKQDLNLKKQFLEYILNDLKIIPTLKSINYLCTLNGNNLQIIKMFIEKGYYSIENQSDTALLLCTLKEKDFELFDKILKLNKELKNNFQCFFHTTNLLLTKSNNIRFYHSLFGIEKNDIVESGYKYNYSQKMYNLTSTAIQYANLDIIKYLSINKPIDHHYHLRCIATKNDIIDGGLSSIDLLKFFFNGNSDSNGDSNGDGNGDGDNQTIFSNMEINNLFIEFCRNGKIECLQYLIKRFKKVIDLNFKSRDSALESNNIETFDWVLKNSDKDNIKKGICSSTGLDLIIQITLFSLKNKILFQYYIDLILNPINRNLNLINDDQIIDIVKNYYSLQEDDSNFIFQYLKNESKRF